MPGNRATERVIWAAWVAVGWVALILLAGLATLLLLSRVSPLMAAGPYHDLLGTLFVAVTWPVVTVVFRFGFKHGLVELLGWY
jgi:hypothetical protein